MGLIENAISMNCIKDRLASHGYILIYTVIETILFPTITIFSRSKFAPAITGMLLLQIMEFSITMRLRPF